MIKYIFLENGVIDSQPFDWNKSFIDNALIQYGIDTNTSYEHEPSSFIHYSDSIAIMPCIVVEPTYNDITHSLSDVYDISINQEDGLYYAELQLVENSIEEARVILKNKLAYNRWEKEISGFTLSVNNVNVTIDTNRDTRNMYFQAMMIMSDDQEILWKFDEGHILLNKQNFQEIFGIGSQYIINLFEQEYFIKLEIDNASTMNELLQIDISF